MRIGTASITRSMTATAEAIFWGAIEAFAIRAHIMSLDPRNRPGNVLACTNRNAPRDETALHYCCRHGFGTRVKYGYGSAKKT